jgi:polyribonucleotide nucleotidyltransferase
MVKKREIDVGGRSFSIETGRVARQANGAAWVRFGDTVLLATAVGAKEPALGLGFFPLTVDYREKAYAAGKIPGGFFKREGRPSENEIISARITDRSLRPRFPKDFQNEVQVMIAVLSADKQNDPDIMGITAASAALCLSEIPFDGPIAGVRVGRVNGEWVLNPTFEQREKSDIDLVIAASEDSIVMVEGESLEISEADMAEALAFGHENAQLFIRMQHELVAEAGKPKMEYTPVKPSEEFEAEVRKAATDKVREAVTLTDKAARRDKLDEIVDELVTLFEEKYPEEISFVGSIVHDIDKELVRSMIADEGRRLDGRGIDDIRPISIEVGVLPRAHGSALFTRGQTQALAATTLGTKMDEQKMDELEGEFWKSYMLHYNFPPFSVGEIRPLRGPGRREIGHGHLAERALKPVIPSEEVFPYTIRVVSDILESNGSSSMATVCAGSLSLMDAGVPVKTGVAGIAMGLIKEGDRYIVLTDILGDEDHLGDMDFKVAGTEDGITAFQMDIKIKGISTEVMQEALERAKQARLYILDVMRQALPEPRPHLSPFAPRIISFKVPVESIGAVIGPGGRMIREIIERTGATIDIEDDGTVRIASVDEEAAEKAREIIEGLTQQPEVGKVYTGRVKKITNFGAFVEILPGKEGLLHISEIEHRRIGRVEDVLHVGDEVKVKLLKVDEQGKLDLSRKALIERTPEEQAAHDERRRSRPPRFSKERK